MFTFATLTALFTIFAMVACWPKRPAPDRSARYLRGEFTRAQREFFDGGSFR
jgi:hypothetical protein